MEGTRQNPIVIADDLHSAEGQILPVRDIFGADILHLLDFFGDRVVPIDVDAPISISSDESGDDEVDSIGDESWETDSGDDAYTGGDVQMGYPLNLV